MTMQWNEATKIGVGSASGTLGVYHGDDIVVHVQFTICDKNNNIVYRDPNSGVYALTLNDLIKRTKALASLSFLPGQGQVCYRIWSIEHGIEWVDILAGALPTEGLTDALYEIITGKKLPSGNQTSPYESGEITQIGCWDGANWVDSSGCGLPSQQVKTTTPVNFTCPPGYTPTYDPVAKVNKCVRTPLLRLPGMRVTPVAYQRPPTTVAFITPQIPVRSYIRPPTTVMGTPETTDLGLGQPVGMPDSEIALAKATLSAWNGSDGNNCIASYGLQPADISLVWGDRDGWALACFTNWWNKSGYAKLPQPGTRSEIAWSDLDYDHANALKSWAAGKGVTIVPGQLPNFGFPSGGGATVPPIIPPNILPTFTPPDVTQQGQPRIPTPPPSGGSTPTCDPGYHLDPSSNLCQPDLPPAAQQRQPPSGTTTTTSTSTTSEKTPILIGVGLVIALGLAAAIFGGRAAAAAAPTRVSARRAA